MKCKSKSEIAGDKGIFKVLWPRGRKAGVITALARRLDRMEAKTICELWDGLFRGNEIFPILRKSLPLRYPEIKVVPWTEFPKDGDHGLPDWEAHPNLLGEKGCDAVIVATGA